MLRTKGITLLAATLLTAGLLAGCGEAKENAATEAAQATNGANANSPVGNADADQPANSGNAATGPVKIIHAWGETELGATPQKVVTLDFSFIDTLVALGVTPAGNAGVGETKIPEYLQDQISGEVADVGERKAPNLEVIESVGPDLILASQDRQNMIKTELQAIAPTIALDDNSYQEILDNVDTIAKALGKEAEAEQVRKNLEDRIGEAKRQIGNQPSVLVIGAFDDEFTVWLKGSFIGSLLTDIGANYAFEGEKAELEGKAEGAKMTLERLSEINPDFIFMYGDDVDKYKDNPLFGSLKAVQDNHMISVDRNLWSRGRGPTAANKILDEAIPLLTGQSSK
ncbi:ABC transporter substrate-binding protein [Paenibacillus macerans]|uniref:ABC transporter substrate-binding protein n=1 Tax=Paenibacillus macerans TaxID=44252 RepID=UPI003D323372